jgi:alanine racemase
VGRVLIRGQYAPILGRVCMDQMMVDVTDIEGVDLFDEVTLMGADGENRISAEEIGSLSHSFNYEIVCDISKRVPRVFYENGNEKKVIDYLTETLTELE